MEHTSKYESHRSWHAQSSVAGDVTGRSPHIPDDPVRAQLHACLNAEEGEPQDWQAAADAMAAVAPVDLTEDEPGVVLVEQLAALASPSQLLPVFEHLHPHTRTLLFEQWRQVAYAIPLGPTPPIDDYAAAARAYTTLRAESVANLLEERFLEAGDDPRNRGDLYLARNDRYFYNFTYLCGDLEFSRDDTIRALRALASSVEPSDQDFERLGGRTSFAQLIEQLVPLEGDQIPLALLELLPLLEVPFRQVTQHLPRRLLSRLTVTAVARRLGFDLSSQQLLELYELFTILDHLEDHERTLRFLTNIHGFEPKTDKVRLGPPKIWREHWQQVCSDVPEKTLKALICNLLPVYAHFGDMIGEAPCYRQTIAWQAASIDHPEAARWVMRMTTEHGEQSPVLAATLLHDQMPPKALHNLTKEWLTRTAQVPVQSSWSRDFVILVLRFAITRQRRWLLDRLTDLYLRGGGYEADETREIIEAVLERLLDEMELSDAERTRLEESGLAFDLLPKTINVFTGEIVDASRWASPTSAYKYVRTLLRLEDRGLNYLASLVSERRIITIEKALRQLDFHTSVQQIVACVQAYGDDAASALALILQLRDSKGERPSDAWLDQTRVLLEPLGDGVACKLLWTLYRWDQGDAYSLNPGLFWALRLVPEASSVAQLAKAATEMVRRKPSFAIAALDTLDAISTRSALSAILQMRRRIRNRKVIKLINRTIDRIADEEGLDRDVFLDYAVDTGELERDGARLFDFGSHRVTLRLELDGRLSTTVVDAKGRHLRSFPKTAKDADPKLYKAFQSTKKLLVETLSYQTRRLEQAMINRRYWRGRDFTEIFGEHPVMAHLGRRLLWARLDDQNQPIDAFIQTLEGARSADGSAIKLDDDDRICILHPLNLDDDGRNHWQTVLDTEKIEQPFEQVQRDVYQPLTSELETQHTQRLISLKAPSQELYRVVKERGWSTDGGGPWEVGNATHSYRHYPSANQTAHLDTDTLGYDKELTITNIRFTNGTKDNEALDIAHVDPIVYSESFRDLMLCLEPSH